MLREPAAPVRLTYRSEQLEVHLSSTLVYQGETGHDEAERELREQIEATENNLEDMTPKKRRELYQDLSLRVDVGKDGHPYISGIFPTRVAGMAGTLLRTPAQRGHLYTREALPLAERGYVSKKVTSSSRVVGIIHRP
jgi:hypothetical protein